MTSSVFVGQSWIQQCCSYQNFFRDVKHSSKVIYARLNQKNIFKQYTELLGRKYSCQRDKAGVPQGSVLEPVIYSLYAWDVSHMKKVTVDTFTDGTAVLVVSDNNEETAVRLQETCKTVYYCPRNREHST